MASHLKSSGVRGAANYIPATKVVGLGRGSPMRAGLARATARICKIVSAAERAVARCALLTHCPYLVSVLAGHTAARLPGFGTRNPGRQCRERMPKAPFRVRSNGPAILIHRHRDCRDASAQRCELLLAAIIPDDRPGWVERERGGGGEEEEGERNPRRPYGIVHLPLG
jgi:hypothetical protein